MLGSIELLNNKINAIITIIDEMKYILSLFLKYIKPETHKLNKYKILQILTSFERSKLNNPKISYVKAKYLKKKGFAIIY